jgi:hypothetical protein
LAGSSGVTSFRYASQQPFAIARTRKM